MTFYLNTVLKKAKRRSYAGSSARTLRTSRTTAAKPFIGMTAISAHVELPWKGQTSDETLLDIVRGEKSCLLHAPALSGPVHI